MIFFVVPYLGGGMGNLTPLHIREITMIGTSDGPEMTTVSFVLCCYFYVFRLRGNFGGVTLRIDTLTRVKWICGRCHLLRLVEIHRCVLVRLYTSMAVYD